MIGDGNSKKQGDVSCNDRTITNEVAGKVYGKRSCLDATIDHDFDELNGDIDLVAELRVEHFLQDDFAESYSSHVNQYQDLKHKQKRKNVSDSVNANKRQRMFRPRKAKTNPNHEGKSSKNLISV
ncbi:hypothetical protein Tco_1003171 [Tanacetum coccineum]|uniref:Uncharacterized protein n=1 Tax=Tanacetum coccineum TaxID=301880 RepID=A0ABQ5F8A8_9ASTR